MRPKLSDVLEAELLKDIRAGFFGPEGRLPSENELSKRFGVSRPIVREALKRLRDDGLIHSRQGAGSFVRAVEKPQPKPADPVPLVQSIADVRKFYEYRLLIEGEIAASAAQHANDEAIRLIKSKLDLIQNAIDGGLVGVDQDYEFHFSIASATGNHFFENALNLVQPHLGFVIDLARSFSILGTGEHLAMVQGEHTAVYEAIVKRDPEGARASMRAHIAAAQERVFFGTHRPARGRSAAEI